MLYSINYPSLIVWLLLLCVILGTMRTAIVYEPDCEVTNSEINLEIEINKWNTWSFHNAIVLCDKSEFLVRKWECCVGLRNNCNITVANCQINEWEEKNLSNKILFFHAGLITVEKKQGLFFVKIHICWIYHLKYRRLLQYNCHFHFQLIK